MLVSLKIFFLLIWLASAPSSVGLAANGVTLLGSSAESVEPDLRAHDLRKVLRVVDGDTIVVSPNERVRLIGVDTPETAHPVKAVQCFGREAKEFTRRMADGQTVRLVLDQSNAVRRHRDKYGRILAYVYLEDGTQLNADLIRRGYAHAYTRFPFRYIVEFRALEREARRQEVGLWSGCRFQ
jgi:micrococcal nuclease